MEISGIIESGAGKGAYFTQLEWVVKQCREILGYGPFPGTLNVRVANEDRSRLRKFLSDADLTLASDDPAFCAARVKKVAINRIPAAVVLPSEDVRIHENTIIELIAPCNLKETLGLEDGGRVTVSSA